MTGSDVSITEGSYTVPIWDQHAIERAFQRSFTTDKLSYREQEYRGLVLDTFLCDGCGLEFPGECYCQEAIWKDWR